MHPRALLEYERLSQEEQRHIDQPIAGYGDRRRNFMARVAEGIGMIAAAFSPKEVIVRLSDFKSNEYALLFGGQHFEPKEQNPMLGLRGAARNYDPSFRDSFAMAMSGLEKCMRRHRRDQCFGHDPVCAQRGRSAEGDRRHGRTRSGARTAGPQAVSHVRNTDERAARRGLSGAVRRLVHRLQ